MEEAVTTIQWISTKNDKRTKISKAMKERNKQNACPGKRNIMLRTFAMDS